MSVITALEFDNLAASGGAARKPDCGHRRFGPGVDHAQHLHRWHQSGDGFRHHHLCGAWRTKGQTVAYRVFHRLAYRRMVMASDHGAPGSDVVDVALAFPVEQIRTVGARGEKGLATHCLERAHRGVHAAGQQRLCALKKFVVARHVIAPKRLWKAGCSCPLSDLRLHLATGAGAPRRHWVERAAACTISARAAHASSVHAFASPTKLREWNIVACQESEK